MAIETLEKEYIGVSEIMRELGVTRNDVTTWLRHADNILPSRKLLSSRAIRRADYARFCEAHRDLIEAAQKRR